MLKTIHSSPFRGRLGGGPEVRREFCKICPKLSQLRANAFNNKE